MKEAGSEISEKERMKALGQEWKALTEEAKVVSYYDVKSPTILKQQWNQKAAKLREEYNEQIGGSKGKKVAAKKKVEAETKKVEEKKAEPKKQQKEEIELEGTDEQMLEALTKKLVMSLKKRQPDPAAELKAPDKTKKKVEAESKTKSAEDDQAEADPKPKATTKPTEEDDFVKQ